MRQKVEMEKNEKAIQIADWGLCDVFMEKIDHQVYCLHILK